MKKAKLDAMNDAVPEAAAPEVPDVPDVPEVPDADELKDQAEAKAGEVVEEVKEKAEDAAGDMAGNLKWKLMIAAIKNKLSCCYGGTETSNAGILG